MSNATDGRIRTLRKVDSTMSDVSKSSSMAFPHGVPDGQTVQAPMAKPVAKHRAQLTVVQAICEAVQWGMLPAVLYLLMSNVLTSGQVVARDIGVAGMLAGVVSVLAYAMSRRY